MDREEERIERGRRGGVGEIDGELNFCIIEGFLVFFSLYFVFGIVYWVWVSCLVYLSFSLFYLGIYLVVFLFRE